MVKINHIIANSIKDFLKFLSQKFKELGMKIKEHEHKVIYTITNYDWKCNECVKFKI